MQNSKLNKLRTVLSVLVLAFTLFSFAFTISESNHNCTEENCPICYVLQVVESNLKIFALSFFALKLFQFAFSFQKNKISSININFITNTLFSQRTRFNN